MGNRAPRLGRSCGPALRSAVGLIVAAGTFSEVLVSRLGFGATSLGVVCPAVVAFPKDGADGTFTVRALVAGPFTEVG